MVRTLLGIWLLLTAPLRAQPSAAYCPRQLPAPLPTVAGCSETCGGVDRWSVKTLTDRDVDAIDWTPRPTTIAALGALRRVATRPQDRRASVHERRVYCVEGLLEIQDPHPQDDGDLHVVLMDPGDARRSMVVEIPDPKCRNVCGSPWASVFANARADLEGRIQRETQDTIRVIVTGVGFFDRNHGQVGAAPNFFELHPVLSVRFPERVQGTSGQDAAAVARDAVTRFYAWYVPTSANTPMTDMQALSDPRWRFSPALAKALRADSTASANSPDEIVGLDMDPFLNSQDPCAHYAITGVRRAGADFLVDVHGTGGCGRRGAPDVTVRVSFDDKGPVFVNFVYSRNRRDDLRSLLAQLARERQR